MCVRTYFLLQILALFDHSSPSLPGTKLTWAAGSFCGGANVCLKRRERPPPPPPRCEGMKRHTYTT